MIADPLTCPLCNSFVTVAPGTPVGRRVPCPRCGEAFTLTAPPPAGSPDLQQTPTSAPGTVRADLALGQRSLRSPRSNRLVAAAVLGVMVLMAAGGLVLALRTVGDRRTHDTAMPPPRRRGPQPVDTPEVPPAAPTPAARLPALGWLPPDTTVVAGIDAAELRRTPNGRDLLASALKALAPGASPDDLESLTGLKWEAIDHVVLGLKADDGIPPRLTLVVRTKEPYDAKAVRDALRAQPAPAPGGKSLYSFKPKEGWLKLHLWCADDRTLIVGLLPSHVAAVPSRPADGAGRLPEEVRTLLEKRVEAESPVWAVGFADDWKQTGAPLLLSRLPQEDFDRLNRVRSFAVCLTPASRGVSAALKCDDDAAASALEKRLLDAKPADADWTTAREDDVWLLLQLRGGLKELFQGVGK